MGTVSLPEGLKQKLIATGNAQTGKLSGIFSVFWYALQTFHGEA